MLMAVTNDLKLVKRFGGWKSDDIHAYLYAEVAKHVAIAASSRAGFESGSVSDEDNSGRRNPLHAPAVAVLNTQVQAAGHNAYQALGIPQNAFREEARVPIQRHDAFGHGADGELARGDEANAGIRTRDCAIAVPELPAATLGKGAASNGNGRPSDLPIRKLGQQEHHLPRNRYLRRKC